MSKPRLIDFLPLVAIAGIYFLVKRQTPEPAEPQKPQFPRGGEVVEPPIPGTGPERNPYVFDGNPLTGLTPETLTRVNSTSPTVADLGNNMLVILNATDSFEDLFDQAFDLEKADALIDIHFNRYKGKHSGPLMLHSRDGKALAASLQREFIEIYQENGWQYGKELDIRFNDYFKLPKLGNLAGKPVVISEFGYVDDPANPIGEWIQTTQGQERIARAYVNALRGSDYKKVALSLGHHGNRGSGGAKYKSYTETEFAEDTVNAILRQQGTGRETGIVAEGYHHDSDAEEPPKEQAGNRPPDLRKASSNYPTYYGPNGESWSEITPGSITPGKPQEEVKAKPRAKFQLFKRKRSS
jgi:hypothetical protein